MDAKLIWDDDKKGFTRIFSEEKIEKVNPVEYYKKIELEKRALGLRDMLYAQNPFLTSLLDDSFFEKKAKEFLGDFFNQFESVEIPQNFLKLLETTKKSEQIKLLKGQSINPDQLMALIFKSYEILGMVYSRYLFEKLSKGIDPENLPKIIHVLDDGKVKTVGKTEMTEGQLKNVIRYRKSIVAHFFEKDGDWHCLFVTYASMRGEENWKNGQPHFHYISSAFGISKEDFIKSMEDGNYKSTSVHIDLLDYGNQPE